MPFEVFPVNKVALQMQIRASRFDFILIFAPKIEVVSVFRHQINGFSSSSRSALCDSADNHNVRGFFYALALSTVNVNETYDLVERFVSR